MALPRPRVAEQKTETHVADGLQTGFEASPWVPDQHVSLGAGSAGDSPPGPYCCWGFVTQNWVGSLKKRPVLSVTVPGKEGDSQLPSTLSTDL